MSASEASTCVGACMACMRRSWLLWELSGPLDYRARDRGRLLALLALPDEQLLQAVGGRRTHEHAARYERFHASELSPTPGGEIICRHTNAYPRALSGPAAPHVLELSCTVQRFMRLMAAPVVAIVGSRAASDYGMEMATSLARGLAASNVTIVASLTDGIAIAAHTGALEARAASVAVMGGGLSVSCPARRRSLYQRVRSCGCAISELPSDCGGRRWGQLASERIVVELAELVVLVEAPDTPQELAGVRMAQRLGRPLAAIPGRVTSPLASGPHALLIDGASLIRGAADALELLYTLSQTDKDEQRRPLLPGGHDPADGLKPSLRVLLERVGAGDDTPDKLTNSVTDPAEVLRGLSELELAGLLARGAGGRYVPREPLPACTP